MEGSTVVFWIIGLIVIYFVGIYEGRIQGRKRRIKEEEKEKAERAEDAPALPEPLKVDDPGILRVKKENDVIMIDLDGQTVQPSSLTADQRKRLIEILNLMRPWLGDRAEPARAPTTPPPPAPVVAPKPVDVPAPQTVTAAATTNKASAAEDKKGPDSKTVPLSIVAQINAVLQQRIANTPLEARGLTLMESPSGGVNVYVGVQRYEAIDDVPDEEAKAAIRAAIAEWEKKFTPG
jgi:hypothetical protein